MYKIGGRRRGDTGESYTRIAANAAPVRATELNEDHNMSYEVSIFHFRLFKFSERVGLFHCAFRFSVFFVVCRCRVFRSIMAAASKVVDLTSDDEDKISPRSVNAVEVVSKDKAKASTEADVASGSKSNAPTTTTFRFFGDNAQALTDKINSSLAELKTTTEENHIGVLTAMLQKHKDGVRKLKHKWLAERQEWEAERQEWEAKTRALEQRVEELQRV